MAAVKKVKEGWDGAEKGAHLDAHMMLSHVSFSLLSFLTQL